jgi:hypothetical protein
MKWGPFNGYKNSMTTELFVASSIGMYEAFEAQSRRSRRGVGLGIVG